MIFALLLLLNRPRLSCRVSGLVWGSFYFASDLLWKSSMHLAILCGNEIHFDDGRWLVERVKPATWGRNVVLWAEAYKHPLYGRVRYERTN